MSEIDDFYETLIYALVLTYAFWETSINHVISYFFIYVNVRYVNIVANVYVLVRFYLVLFKGMR